MATIASLTQIHTSNPYNLLNGIGYDALVHVVDSIFSNMISSASKGLNGFDNLDKELKAFSAFPLVSKDFNDAWNDSSIKRNELFDVSFHKIIKYLLNLSKNENGKEKASERIVRIAKVLDAACSDQETIQILSSIGKSIEPLFKTVSVREKLTITLPCIDLSIRGEVVYCSIMSTLAGTAGIVGFIVSDQPAVQVALVFAASALFVFAVLQCASPTYYEDAFNSGVDATIEQHLLDLGVSAAPSIKDENSHLLTLSSTSEDEGIDLRSASSSDEGFSRLIDWVNEDLEEIVVSSD